MNNQSLKLLLAVALNLALTPNLYAAPGDLDSSFGIGGTVSTNVSTYGDQIKGVAIQPDGKIVVVGHTYYGAGNDIQVARYLSNGELDLTFDFDGIAITNFPGSSSTYAESIAIQTDGKIVVGGNSYPTGGVVLRYNQDGSLDNSFGINGSTAAISNLAIAIQPDGKILAAGSKGVRLAITRLNVDGSIDTSFGNQGVSKGGVIGNYAQANAIVLQPDGAILTAGEVSQPNGNLLMTVARHTSTGDVDKSFGNNGRIIVKMDKSSYYESAQAISLQADGRIVISGVMISPTGVECILAFARLNTDGTFDTSFSGDGRYSQINGSASDYGRCSKAGLIQPDGKIVAAGTDDSNIGVFRMNADGTLDNTFGINGAGTYQSTYFGADGIALQADGKLLVGGSSSDYHLMRLLANDVNDDGLAEPWDLTPDAFAFSTVTNASPGTLQISSPITVSGLGTGVYAPLRISGGEYAKNGGAYSSLAGSVQNGDVLTLRHTSATSPGSSVTTTLKIGGLYSPNNSELQLAPAAQAAESFTSITASASAGQ